MASRRKTFWRSVVGFLILMVGLMAGGNVAIAQSSIDCSEYPAPAAAAPAASPSASPEAVAEPVAFPAEGGEVTVFAAVSLTDAFEEIGTDITAANPGVTFVFNFAGSQALVTQLTEGAEADVFASANNSQMNAAIEADVIAGEPETFAKNDLVIIVPADNPAGITSAADLGNPDIAFVTAQAEVPVGQYTRQAVCNMGAATATYGEEFADRFAANIVSEEENVRAIATKVSLGEADAGIVYATDVTPDIESSVMVIPIPPEVNVIASYPVAAVAGGDEALATAFVSYLLGSEGQATLAEWGFKPVS